MTGYGSRFAAAGYKELKPLICVQGRPIVEWIVKGTYAADDGFIFICRGEHLRTMSGMRSFLEGLAEKVEVVSIENWKK